MLHTWESPRKEPKVIRSPSGVHVGRISLPSIVSLLRVPRSISRSTPWEERSIG